MAGELLERPKLHTGKGSKLRQDELIAVLQLHKVGKTQVEIAQALGCDQATVSRWLSRFTDTTEVASAYLKGKAFDMAKSVAAGPEHVQLKALQGLGVAAQGESSSKVQVLVGISLPGMPASPSPTVSVDMHRLTEANTGE